jgi:hypothetical protein
MAFWQITYGGVTQDAATWGISNLTRKRMSATTGTVTFKLNGTAFDTSPLPFAWLQPLSITRNGMPWFSGIVTKPQPKAKADAESIDYEISDPWYFLEKTVFQQQWITTDPYTGAALSTQTTTRSNVILGQSLDGVKMNSGQVMMEVLLYAQYAFQKIPFPTTVTVAQLPPAPAVAAPFIIGVITPSIVVPYTQVRDKSCADIIRLMMKYSPDAVAWMDYSTSPPTLNIDKRANLDAKTISVLNGLLVGAFNPTPRYDLQVPVVVAKWEQKQSIDGTTYDFTTVDSYPPAPVGVDQGAWESQPRAWAQTIDLLGGETTQQSVAIGTIPRPVTAADVAALNWALKKQPNLTATKGIPYVDVGAPLYDTANMVVDFVNTVIDAADPLNDPNQNPNNITIRGGNNDCPQLVNELLTGQFPPWLQEDPNDLDTAKVRIEVHLKYTGTDPATQVLFWQDPTNSQNIIKDGTGVYIFFWTGKVTNADTQTYSQLTSWAEAEPVPVGYAEQLYNALAQLHFQGDLIMIEQECSDQLPIGCIFNTTDGNPDWQAMDALVLGVTEDIDLGTTSVQFGPPLMLGLGELEELFRANLGRLPSWKLSQRTSGVLTAASNVIGAEHAADTHVINPQSAPGVGKPLPWAPTITKVGGLYVLQIGPGLLMKSQVLNDSMAISNLSPSTLAINQNAPDFAYLEVAVSNLEPTGNGTVNSGSAGGTFDPTASAWDSGGKAYVAQDMSTPPNQTFFRVLLATTAIVNGVPVATPRCTANLQIFTVPLAGYAALMAYPANTAS